MRALARHRLIRFATLFLLAWISVDLCWPDACADDAFDGTYDGASFSHQNDRAPKHQGVLHPDHCFCHARSVTLEAFVLISAPAQSSALCPLPIDQTPSASLASLYHPPQVQL